MQESEIPHDGVMPKLELNFQFGCGIQDARFETGQSLVSCIIASRSGLDEDIDHPRVL